MRFNCFRGNVLGDEFKFLFKFFYNNGLKKILSL